MKFALLLSMLFHISESLDLLPYPSSTLPVGQAGPLYIALSTNLTAAETTTLQTLSGVLARHSPRIYTLHSDPATPAPGDTTVLWLQRLRLQAPALEWSQAYMKDPVRGLLEHFAPNVTGYVRFRPGSNSTNAALTFCAGTEAAVVAVGDPATESLLAALGIPLIADVSELDPVDVLRNEHIAQTLSRRCVAAQPDDGGKVNRLTDYAVMARCPTLEHASGSVAFKEALARLDDSGDGINVCLGWTSYDEHEFVSACSGAGAVVNPSDFVSNMALFANLPSGLFRGLEGGFGGTTPPAPAPLREPHHTVAFVMSDGDNLQLIQNDFQGERWWGSPERGALPVGWSLSAATAALLPNALAHFQATATANDSLSCGPSGAGYSYPSRFSSGKATANARATAALMQAAEQTALNVIGVVPSRESLEALAAQEQVKQIVYFTFSSARMGYSSLRGNVDFVHQTPIVGARLNLWGDGQDPAASDELGVEALANELAGLPKDPSSWEGYSIVVVTPSHNYSDVVRVGELLRDAGGVEVVLPEVLVARLEKAGVRTRCTLPTGPWSAQVGDLPKCSLPQNRSGGCLMTCENIRLPENALPRRLACDLDVCHEGLSLAEDGRALVCKDGVTLCPSSLE